MEANLHTVLTVKLYILYCTWCNYFLMDFPFFEGGKGRLEMIRFWEYANFAFLGFDFLVKLKIGLRKLGDIFQNENF